jgi:hypothetical protein
MMNKSMWSSNKSGIIGVSWDSLREKWSVRIRFEDKYKGIGQYDTLEDANHGGIKAVNKYNGEFAHNSQKLA